MMKPRFRFSLRALFVSFTIVAVWLGWNANIVHQRKAFLALLEQGDCFTLANAQWEQGTVSYSFSMTDVYAAQAVGHPTRYSHHRRSARFTMPTLRRWMGDELRWLIAYRPGPDISEVKRLFPEAQILLVESKSTASK